jgi:hypothetical protein
MKTTKPGLPKRVKEEGRKGMPTPPGLRRWAGKGGIGYRERVGVGSSRVAENSDEETN